RAQDREVREHDEQQDELRCGVHCQRIRRMSPKNANAPAPARSCGTRVSRRRAMEDSTTPTAAAVIIRPPSSATNDAGADNPLRGTNTSVTSAPKTASLTALLGGQIITAAAVGVVESSM